MVKLFRKNSNLCDHNPPTSQTDRRHAIEVKILTLGSELTNVDASINSGKSTLGRFTVSDSPYIPVR